MDQVEASFNVVESFLVSQSSAWYEYNNIENPRTEFDRYLAEYNIKNTFDTTLAGYEMIEGIFMYYPREDIYIQSEKSHISSQKLKGIETKIKSEMIKRYEEVNSEIDKWVPVNLNDQFYLIRIIKIKNIYIGSWVNIDNIVAPLQEKSFKVIQNIMFCDAKGIPLDKDFDHLIIPINEDGIVESTHLMYKGERYFTTGVGSHKGLFYLVAMIRDNSVLEGLDAFQSLLIIVAFSVLISIILFSILIRKLLYNPLHVIVDAMNRLKDGNLDVKLEDMSVCEEFEVVNHTFDNMTKQIKKLKIDVYEEKITKQKAELQYLQLQINPHFLVNCLNLIRNLAIMGKNELIQEVTIILSHYMRYTLNTGTRVTVEQELRHVYNYIKLQQLRYQNGLICHVAVDEALEKAFIPTMLIQTFVENSVKYQMVQGEELTINVSVTLVKEVDGPKMEIIILDSGDGFDLEILEKVRRNEKIVNRDGEHTGIYNVRQRLAILYNDLAKIEFSNTECGGAEVKMIIPIDSGGVGGKK
jgi:two-component system sensor histidine kinase YesM